MEENNILNKKNKKKILIGSVIIVLVLLLVVVGSTYAYFSLQVNGEGTSTKVTITTGSNKQIKLSGGLEDFHIKLDVKDMAYNRKDWEYYATDNKELNYVTDKVNGLKEIGKVEIIGDLEERQVCTAKAKVNLSGDMANLIREGDLEISLVNGIYENTSDLTEIDSNYPAELKFVLDNTKPIEPEQIKAYLKFTNQDKEQNYLAGKTLNVSIIIDDFKCTTDTTAPVIDKIYFNEKTEGQHYTNNISNTLYMSWLDEDVKEYCITTNDSYEECSWKETNGQNNISETITLDGIEGDHLYNGYLKDNAGNISIKGTASIIYDKTLPTIDKFYIKEEGSPKYTNQNKNKVYFQYTDTNIKDMCVTEETTSNNCQWTPISESMDYTFANNNEGLKTIYGYVRDKAGNISSTVNTDTITYDYTAPIITSVVATDTQETSLTLSITANDNKQGVSQTSGIDKYCYSQKNSTNEGDYICGASASITINNLNAGTSYDFYIYAKDNAGNGSPTNRISYQFVTKSLGLSPYDALTQTTTGAYLKTAEDNEVLSYVGTKDDVTKENIKNFICFGTDNKETCLEDKNTYMYRIIGITTSNVNKELGLVPNQLKLIKASPIIEDGNVKRLSWATSSRSGDNITWDYEPTNATNGAILRYYLNDTFLGTIKGNIKNGITWQSIISQPKWYNGDFTGGTVDSSSLTLEKASITNSAYKIGIMYRNDYYNSGSQNKNNWLHITNGMSESSNAYSGLNEWTMMRTGLWTVSAHAFVVKYDGSWYSLYLHESTAVRPVFYLIPNITLTGGGTEKDPFIIHAS